MLNKKRIEEEIDQANSLQALTYAYEEIASIRMKKSRNLVLTRRDFLSEINEVFHQVRFSYARQAMALAKKRKIRQGEKLTFLAHNGKTVAVFLSANTGLYGDIIRRTFNEFLTEVRKGECEVTIVGKYGLSLYLQEESDRPYTFFDLADYQAKTKQVAKIIKHIVAYEKIHVYYGKFMNVINQKPTMYSISADIGSASDIKDKGDLYLFEPTLENILMFFEREIFASLFEQAVNESELAKFASRVVAMDKAAENLKNYSKQLQTQKLRAAHNLANRKQLNSLSSMFFR